MIPHRAGPLSYLPAVALTLTAAASVMMSFSARAETAAKGKLVLAWHAGLASRWLDPQEHDGTATPDNFLTAIHDALIKNQGTELYNHRALAEHFTVAADSKSATQDVFPTITTGYAYPWEDLKVRDQ